MKKLLFLLLLPLWISAQVSTGQEQDFDYGIRNISSQTVATPDTLVTRGADGTYGHTSASLLPLSTATTNALELETDVSAGAVSGFTLTNNGNGTVNISSGIAYLRATNDPYTPIIKYPIAAVTNLALTDNANNYVLVDYNGGSPTLTVTTNGSTINTQTNSLAFVIARVGNDLEYLSLVGQNVDPNAKLRIRFLNQEGIRRASGAVLGFSNRNLTLTSSVLFSGLIRVNAASFNTASPDTFTLVYNNGSTWTRTVGQTQVNNTEYNASGTLTTMSNNTFRTDYVYLLPNNPSKLYVVLGTTTYGSLTLAKAAPRPSSLPVELQVLGLEVGRLFIEKNSATIAEVQSSFANDFIGAPVPEHNSLTGLQGGTAGQYNHLTNAQVALVDGSEQTANKQNSLATDGTGVKFPTVDAVNKGISGATNFNRYDILNKDVSNVFKSSGTLVLTPIQNPTNYDKILRFTPTIADAQQISYSSPTVINPLKTSTIGFWIKNTNIENGIFITLSYYDSDYVNMGGNEEIYISTPNLSVLGYTTSNGYLSLLVKEVKEGWTFIQLKHSPNPTKTAARFYGQNFFLDSNLANTDYDFAGFVMINDDVELNAYSNYSENYNQYINHWQGKKIVWAGDSIFAVNKSQQIALNELGLLGNNQARSGSTVTPGYGFNPTGGESTLELVPDIIDANPDIVYINAGTNDYGYGVPLGAITDTDTITFYGAYKRMIKLLVEGLPNAKILTSTPIYGNQNIGVNDSLVYNERKLFSDAIIQICNIYGVPVLDKFRNSGIGIGNYQSKLVDGIHPTDATYMDLGIMDKNFIEQHNGISKFDYSISEILSYNNEADSPILFKLPVSSTAKILESYSTSGNGFSIMQDESISGDWFLKRVLSGVYSDVLRANRSNGNVSFYGNVGVKTDTPDMPFTIKTTGDSVGLTIGDTGVSTRKALDLGYLLTSDYGYIQAIHNGTGFKNLSINPNGGKVFFGKSTDDGSGSIVQVLGGVSATNYTGGATLTGTPTAPTATAGTNSTQIATTAFTQEELNSRISGTPDFIPKFDTGNSIENSSFSATGGVMTYNTTYTVSTLPTPSGTAFAVVTDATAPTYLGTLTGGGSVVCPVFYNGTAWVSH